MVMIVKRQRDQPDGDIRMQFFIARDGRPNGRVKVRVGGNGQRERLRPDGQQSQPRDEQ